MNHNDNGLKILNILIAIVSIILPPIYAVCSIATLVSAGHTWSMILVLFIYALICVIGYFGSMVKNFMTVANGKVRTIKSASVFQLLLFLPQMISALIIRCSTNNSSYNGKVFTIFLILFAIMNILAIIRMQKTKGCTGEDVIVQGSSGIVKKILLICIVLPCVFVVCVKGFMTLVSRYPVMTKIMSMAGAIVLAIVAGRIFLWVLKAFSWILPEGNKSGGDSGKSSTPSMAHNKKTESVSNNRAAAEELENRYRTAFKSIAGDSPDRLDWKIVEDSKQSDIKALRESMKQEAKKKGVEKTRYF